METRIKIIHDTFSTRSRRLQPDGNQALDTRIFKWAFRSEMIQLQYMITLNETTTARQKQGTRHAFTLNILSCCNENLKTYLH